MGFMEITSKDQKRKILNHPENGYCLVLHKDERDSISHTTPDMHCHKVERVTQVIDNKAVAVLAGLP